MADRAGDEVEVLQGGVDHAGSVVRIGDVVLRPRGPHATSIHALLAHLHDHGFDGAPAVLGVDRDGRERLRYIPGDVPLPPFPVWSQSDEAVASTARLLRRFHDATVGFDPSSHGPWSDEMADPAPGDDPVLCHNDVCPENVVFRDGVAVAILDFDFAAPGRRTFDLASLARMCVPIDPPENAARTGRAELDPSARLRVVADAYGLDARGRVDVLDILEAQFARGGDFVRRRVEAGEVPFIRMWEAMGGQAFYDRRRAWFTDNRARFAAAMR